jgi:hypothetical protein
MNEELKQQTHRIKQLEMQVEELAIRLKWAEERVKLYQNLAQEIKEAALNSMDGLKQKFELSEIDQEIEAELSKK